MSEGMEVPLSGGLGSGSALATGRSCCTYTRTRLDGIAGKEANVFSRQDPALKGGGDNGVSFVWMTPPPQLSNNQLATQRPG